MLISFSGLPGAGKTTIARTLAEDIRAVHLRIDSVENAIRASGVVPIGRELDDAGYRVAYALAEDNLRLGHIVISDCVNPIALTRDAWLTVARAAAVPIVEVEIVCSDLSEHRRRVETRPSPFESLENVTWQAVVDREYHKWARGVLVIDTAKHTVPEAVNILRDATATTR